MVGYFEYIKQIQDVDEIVEYANLFFNQGNKLSDCKKYNEAINKYTKAIEILPSFYEAIDNRAFCYMDLGKIEEAIKDFKASLVIEPNNFTAIFSIGECYIKLGEFLKSKEYFELANKINPDNKETKKFLELLNNLEEEK